jgi:hypothetical protein
LRGWGGEEVVDMVRFCCKLDFGIFWGFGGFGKKL